MNLVLMLLFWITKGCFSFFLSPHPFSWAVIEARPMEREKATERDGSGMGDCTSWVSEGILEKGLSLQREQSLLRPSLLSLCAC